MKHWNIVRGFQATSGNNYPGNPCSVLFTGGCNMRCPTCHNKQMMRGDDTLPRADKDKLFTVLSSRKQFINSIAITGGEPTIHGDKLIQVIDDLIAEGYGVKLDSNGMNPDMIKQLLGKVDLFAIDVKGPYRLYPELTGGKFTEEEARTNLSKIFEMAKLYPDNFYFRTTVVPAIATDELIEETKSLVPDTLIWTQQEYIEPTE